MDIKQYGYGNFLKNNQKPHIYEYKSEIKIGD